MRWLIEFTPGGLFSRAVRQRIDGPRVRESSEKCRDEGRRRRARRAEDEQKVENEEEEEEEEEEKKKEYTEKGKKRKRRGVDERRRPLFIFDAADVQLASTPAPYDVSSSTLLVLVFARRAML
mgnify:CR=1 FL=1